MIWTYLTYFLTFFAVILIPVYWKHYGAQNFLWLSDISLFLTLASLWTGSPLFISIASCGILFMEIAWNIDFFLNFIFHKRSVRLADYMFDNRYSYFLRGLSLFHVLIPIIWITYLYEFGYDPRALYYFTALYWSVVITTYCCTNPKENINWVFLPQTLHLQCISPQLWVLILMLGIPSFIALPSHLMLSQLFHSTKAVKISG